MSSNRIVKVGSYSIGNDRKIIIIAGPCAMESRAHAIEMAVALKEISEQCNVGIIYKSSYDKANRSSNKTFRGFGLTEGLRILQEVKKQINVPILTDIHTAEQVEEVASVVDILQTPAFLCRQTDFISAVAKSGKPINIKKGQFLAPQDMEQVVVKAKEANGGIDNIMVCERGASFGYNTLVSDMRSLSIMRNTKCPVVFDATHSVQQPGGQGDRSGGQSEFVPLLARAAVSCGISGIFMETHPNPKAALSDGPNAIPLKQMESLLELLKELDGFVKSKNLFC